MIRFNVPPFTGREFVYMHEAVENGKICGNGPFTKKCEAWMEDRFCAKKVMLTASGSAALDMAAFLCGIQPGDEVILPSYTFSSTANAFILAGAVPVFVDIRPDTLTIDEKKIEEAITDRTKVICPVHYAGTACEMDTIMEIAKKHGLWVVEDAAQAFMSTYKGKACGTIGDFGCFSFHETKNFSMGEGGALVINHEKYIEHAEILREKGTDRSRFIRGDADKYTWVDFGDSYLPSELNAAYLLAQLDAADVIEENRLTAWHRYEDALRPLERHGFAALPEIPEKCAHNAHCFFLMCTDYETRQEYIRYMKENGIECAFHYVPLHSAPAGLKYGRFSCQDEHTTDCSRRMVRLPLYYGITGDELNCVIEKTLAFWNLSNAAGSGQAREGDL